MKRFKEFAQVNEAALKPLPDSRHEPLDEEAPVVDDETQFAFKEGTYEFSELSHDRTGLPFTVWAQPSMGASYGVRVAVSPDRFTYKKDWTLVVVEPELRVVKGAIDSRNLNLLRQWVDLNRSVLTSYWNCDGKIQGQL